MPYSPTWQNMMRQTVNARIVSACSSTNVGITQQTCDEQQQAGLTVNIAVQRQCHNQEVDMTSPDIVDMFSAEVDLFCEDFDRNYKANTPSSKRQTTSNSDDEYQMQSTRRREEVSSSSSSIASAASSEAHESASRPKPKHGIRVTPSTSRTMSITEVNAGRWHRRMALSSEARPRSPLRLVEDTFELSGSNTDNDSDVSMQDAPNMFHDSNKASFEHDTDSMGDSMSTSSVESACQHDPDCTSDAMHDSGYLADDESEDVCQHEAFQTSLRTSHRQSHSFQDEVSGHPPNVQDDPANACSSCGLLWCYCRGGYDGDSMSWSWGSSPPSNSNSTRASTPEVPDRRQSWPPLPILDCHFPWAPRLRTGDTNPEAIDVFGTSQWSLRSRALSDTPEISPKSQWPPLNSHGCTFGKPGYYCPFCTPDTSDEDACSFEDDEEICDICQGRGCWLCDMPEDYGNPRFR